MSPEEHLSDDYIASLLAKDARTSNAKYSAYGLQELLPKRPTYNAPKANTRFLKNIIRETDNHNAALHAKEIAETRSRLEKLHKRSGTPSAGEGAYGRLSREDDHRSKRRLVEIEDGSDLHRPRDHRKRDSEQDKDTQSRSHHSDRKHRDSRYDSDADGDGQSRRHHRHHHHRSHRQRSRCRSPGRFRGSRDCRRSSRSPLRSRSRSLRSERKQYRRRSHHRSDSKPLKPLEEDGEQNPQVQSNGSHEDSIRSEPSAKEKRALSPESDSDPLEAIIGPPPPPPKPEVRARGRGTFASATAMDTHFSSSYDPAVDVQPDPEVDDDWDMALEALRDRQKWQRQGAERLKAAGFTEEEVQKWEKGGEKREEDVRWRGRGEGREWDRGKVIGEDGVETKPEWGRLKGA